MCPVLKRNLLLVLVHADMAVSVFGSCTSPQNAMEAENCTCCRPAAVSLYNLAGNGLSDKY